MQRRRQFLIEAWPHLKDFDFKAQALAARARDADVQVPAPLQRRTDRVAGDSTDSTLIEVFLLT